MKSKKKIILLGSLLYIMVIAFLYSKLPQQKLIVQNETNGITVNEDGSISTAYLSLHTGHYSITLNYHTDMDTPFTIYANTNQTLFENLPAPDSIYTIDLDMLYASDNFRINVPQQDNPSFTLESIIIQSEHLLNRDMLYVMVLVTILFVFCIFYFVVEHKKFSANTIILLVAVLLSSFPLFKTTLAYIPGQDLLVHLSRIEGIKDGLLSGQFPVQIYPGSY